MANIDNNTFLDQITYIFDFRMVYIQFGTLKLFLRDGWTVVIKVSLEP